MPSVKNRSDLVRSPVNLGALARESFALLCLMLLSALFGSGCSPQIAGETATPSAKGPAAPTADPGKVIVEAHWEPWQGERLDWLYEVPVHGQQFRGLTAAEPVRTYSYEDFAVFLPDTEVEVGDCWPVPEEAAKTFLSQFHPDVRPNAGIDGNGTFAVLRARSHTQMEIMIRMHSQFYFPEEIYLSPAQFDGRLVVERSRRKVVHFALSLPTTHARNLAFERHAGDFRVGVGFVPRMELITSNSEPTEHSWAKEMSELEARELLAQKFFAFESIEWLPLATALSRSTEQNKPVFAIVIEGALTDQTC